jgi:glycosyltransferase involved in cell wall biosynthesis
MKSGSSAPPPLAVGVPVYNGEPYLAETLTSLLSQDADFELWIADNCSSDRTEELCRSLQSADRRVHYIRHQRNIGVSENHNRLVRQVSSPLFMWAHADDNHAPGRLAALTDAMRENPEAVLAFTAAKEIDEHGNLLQLWRSPCRVSHPDPVTRFADLIACSYENLHFFGVFRREALLRTQPLSPLVVSDLILVAELSLRGPFIALDGPMLLHRLHPGRLSQADLREWYKVHLADDRRFILPNVEQAPWYFRAVARSPIPLGQKLRAFCALHPWLRRNAMPMARNLARVTVEGVRDVTSRLYGSSSTPPASDAS